jgi:hypothetical protein
MATETSAPAANRPRPWLLVLLALVVAAYAVSRIFSGPSAPAPVPTTSASRPGRGAANGPIDPKELDVRVESLNQKAPPLGEGDRNPFRFQPKPPPEPPPSAYTPPVTKPVDPGPIGPTLPPPPPEPPRIGDTVKFIGIVETANGKIGAFSFWDPQTRECRGVPTPGREGDVIEGRYRVVRLGIESAVLEYLDGKGRATLPLNGQACVVK